MNIAILGRVDLGTDLGPLARAWLIPGDLIITGPGTVHLADCKAAARAKYSTPVEGPILVPAEYPYSLCLKCVGTIAPLELVAG